MWCYQRLKYDSWKEGNWEDRDYFGYGDLVEDPSGRWVLVPYTLHSDYSGSTVERSNTDCFLAEFGDLRGVKELFGGYGTRGVVIRRALLRNEEIADVLESLESYPVIDEDHLSQLEMELETEDWDSWIRSDIQRALDKLEIEYAEDDHVFDAQARQIMEEHSIYWEVESPIAGYIDVAAIAENWGI